MWAGRQEAATHQKTKPGEDDIGMLSSSSADDEEQPEHARVDAVHRRSSSFGPPSEDAAGNLSQCMR